MSLPLEKGDSSSNFTPNTEYHEKDEMISGQDQVRGAQLKMQFHGTRKGDHETIDVYVKQLKSTADSLAAIDSPIPDPDLVLQLLAGLPSQYLPFQKTISSQIPFPTFEEACSMLYKYESKLLLQEQSAKSLSANFREKGDSSSNFTPNTELHEKDEMISGQDQVRRAQLKMQFLGTRRGDHETIDVYVKQLKSTADSLAAIDSPIPDPDLVLQLLAGLPSQYLPFQKTISSQVPFPTFEEACSLLYMYETLLQEQANPNSSTQDNNNSWEEIKQKFGNVLDIFNTVTSVASTAWDLWNVFGTSTPKTANTGNKKYTKRPNAGRGNYRKRGPSNTSFRNSARK